MAPLSLFYVMCRRADGTSKSIIMKKIFLLVALLCVSFLCFAQNDEVNALLKSVEGKYHVDNSNNVYMQEVIEFDSSMTKEQLYFIAKEYTTFAYGDANSVTQVDDKDKGLIICKGLYSDIYCKEIFLGSASKYTATHILKFEIKDRRIRVTLSITNVNTYIPSSYSGGSYISSKSIDNKMTDYYPINNGTREWAEKKFKAREGYVFYRIVIRMLNTIESIKVKFSNPQDFNYGNGNDDW